MTPKALSKYYFPAWQAAAKAHGWENRYTLLLAVRYEFWVSAGLDPVYQQIWRIAEQHAKEAHRATAPNDFRHACHLVALGKDKSSTTLTNDETDRVVALFKLLADPEDLDALLNWQNSTEPRRRRILWWIKHQCQESYVVAVCREKFGCDDPRSLDFGRLQQLHITLRNRPKARKARACALVA